MLDLVLEFDCKNNEDQRKDMVAMIHEQNEVLLNDNVV